MCLIVSNVQIPFSLNVCVLVIKQATRVLKNRGPKTPTSQNIGAPTAALAAPLPTPMITTAVFSCRLCFLRAFPFISLLNTRIWLW